jgi:molybdenum cofactor synthesis domain-containing protein
VLAHPTAAIVTIGNELVSGDTLNTNGSWLASRLEALGIDVLLLAALPDDEQRVARLVREQAAEADIVLVTGGLGGTPDDVTREAIAAAFGVPQVEQSDVAEALRARFADDHEYVTRWAQLPAGSRPLENPLGGRRYRTTESRIVGVLQAGGELHPLVRVGSYPSFGAEGPTVEVVLKSGDPAALAAATTWFERELDALAD